MHVVVQVLLRLYADRNVPRPCPENLRYTDSATAGVTSIVTVCDPSRGCFAVSRTMLACSRANPHRSGASDQRKGIVTNQLRRALQPVL